MISTNYLLLTWDSHSKKREHPFDLNQFPAEHWILETGSNIDNDPGPSHTEAGPSHTEAGPSHTEGAPSHTEVASHPHAEAGPSEAEAGSAHERLIYLSA